MSGEYKLVFELEQRRKPRNGTRKWYYAEYSFIRVLPERYNYQLFVGWLTKNSTTPNDPLKHMNGMQFSTYDNDNDLWLNNSCALSYGGGFWYTACGIVRVNSNRHYSLFWEGLPGWSGGYLKSCSMWLVCK